MRVSRRKLMQPRRLNIILLWLSTLKLLTEGLKSTLIMIYFSMSGSILLAFITLNHFTDAILFKMVIVVYNSEHLISSLILQFLLSGLVI